MGAYKKLNKQDAYITTYVAHKQWSLASSQYYANGIEVLATDDSYVSSLRQLYYPSKSLGNVISHSYDYYSQSTLFNSQSRNLEGDALIISIPRSLYGVSIQPGILIGFTSSSMATGSIVDDNEGGLYLLGSSPKNYVGDIIYTHGIAVITQTAYTASVIDSINFKSSQPIYTYNYHCKIRESEYNFTYNPSALSGSIKTIYDNDGTVYSITGSVNDGALKNNITGSSFQPYITTVGLYNDANELIAVGKMSQPVPKPANTEMTIVVKIDI